MDQWFSTTNTQANNVRIPEILGTVFRKLSFLKGNFWGRGEVGVLGGVERGKTVTGMDVLYEIIIYFFLKQRKLPR